jgi:hypothetical protein
MIPVFERAKTVHALESGHCDRLNESSQSMKVGEFIDQLSEY